MALIIKNFFCIRAMLIQRSVTIRSVKYFSLKKGGKIFTENENDFAHSVLVELPNYKNSVIPVHYNASSATQKCSVEKKLPKWDELSVDELCSHFKLISVKALLENVTIADPLYSEMCSTIAKRCPEMSDENLICILKHLRYWPFCSSPREMNFYIVWKALDNACLERWKSWDVNKSLLFMDLWFHLKLTRQSDFVYKSIRKISSKSRLPPHQLVQVLFYLNVIRTTNIGSMLNLQDQLEAVASQLTIEELGVAAMGFFKTQSKIIYSNLMNHIIDRIIESSSTIPDITLASFLKILRMSLPIPLWDRVPKLLEALEKQLDRLTLQCCIHISLLASNCQILHEGTLTKITSKMANNIKTARLKDLEKVLYPLNALNFTPRTSPCIFQATINEIVDPARRDELDLYPRSLVMLIYNLMMKNYFVESLVAKVLDMNFIQLTYGKNNYMIAREILGIDTLVELKYPSYSGPRLPVPIRNYLFKRHATHLPDPCRKLSKHDEFMLDVYQTSQNLFGKDCVVFKFVVPHYSKAEIIFRLDNDRKPISIPDEFRNPDDFSAPIKAPGENWHAIVCAGRNMFLRDVAVLNGEVSLKLELIKKLNYKPILVPYWSWPRAEANKTEWLDQLINSS